MPTNASDITFTSTVKMIQESKGSRVSYVGMEQGRGWESRITPELKDFLSQLDLFYLGTSNAAGQPYIQYRGGPAGFLKVVDALNQKLSDPNYPAKVERAILFEVHAWDVNCPQHIMRFSPKC